MTATLQDRDSPRQAALHIWKMMSIGPLAFLFWLVAAGLFLLYVAYGASANDLAPPADDAPPGDAVIAIVFWLAPLSVIACEIAGVRAAYARRDMLADTPFGSHATSAIRTFWIMFWGFAATLVMALMLLAIPNIGAVGFGVGVIFVMVAAVPLLFIWNGFRVARGWLCASDGRPVSDQPTRWT
jgi:uncharacterized membrane protein